MEEPALCQPPQIAVISFDLAPNIEIAIKLPTIEKGCQENSSDAALQLSSTGWLGAQGNRGWRRYADSERYLVLFLIRLDTHACPLEYPEAHLR
jgi:hypothetical protein